jgi:thiol:disulfide interchange protein DsbA
MFQRRLWLLLGAALLISACGKPAPGTATAPAPAAKPAAPVHAAAQDAKTSAAAEKPPTLTRLNEDGSETVEETTGDSGARNPLLAAVSSTVAAATTSGAASAGSLSQWPEGSYIKVVPAQPTDVPTGQIEVLEFFWYACPHCYALEPTVSAWNKAKAAYITFVRVPVLWDDRHRALARLYYTLAAMDKVDQLHGDIFKEIQVNNDPLVNGDLGGAAMTERMQVAFIKKMGLSDADFERNYQSLGVDTAMQRADQLVQRYRVTGVPTFVVNGKYITDIGMAGGSPDRLMVLISDLAAQEHKH